METSEQRVETAIRVLFDLDGSRDAAQDAAKVLRMARDGESRLALIQELARIQCRLRRQVDETICRRLADAVVEVAARA